MTLVCLQGRVPDDDTPPQGRHHGDHGRDQSVQRLYHSGSGAAVPRTRVPVPASLIHTT